MFRKIFFIIYLLFLVSAVSAQELTREQKIEELKILTSQANQIQAKLNELGTRRDKISEELLSVSQQDIAEAEKIGAEAERFFPAGLLRGLYSTVFEDTWDYSSKVLMYGLAHSVAPRIEYQNDNSLEFKDYGNIFGFIIDLGGTSMEKINEKNREFIALEKYENFKNTENEFSFDGINFRKKVPVAVGNTFLVRAINKNGGDGILAIKIHRKDSDRSIVLFIKQVKDFSREYYRKDTNSDALKKAAEDISKGLNQENSQIPEPVADSEAQQAVTNALYQKGFYNLTVEATTTEITLRGTIPKGKMAEMMQIAQETAKRKVNNQVIEER